MVALVTGIFYFQIKTVRVINITSSDEDYNILSDEGGVAS